MWFKQIQLFQLAESTDLSIDHLLEELKVFAFRPCLASMPTSTGWISPIDNDDENSPLARCINGYTMLCLQIEEKILPASVVRHELAKKINKIEKAEDRKVRHSEKLTLKDELIVTLLPRAFSKFIKLYAYIDHKHRRIIFSAANAKRVEQFISFFNKTLSDNVCTLSVNNISSLMTHWLKNQDYPKSFSIEKACVLQDPAQQTRVIRCQQQNLFSISVQSFLKEGCEVQQLAVNWQDRVTFILSQDFSLKSIKFQEEILFQAQEMEPETKEQQFDADFLIMSDIISLMLADLSSLLQPEKGLLLNKTA